MQDWYQLLLDWIGLHVLTYSSVLVFSGEVSLSQLIDGGLIIFMMVLIGVAIAIVLGEFPLARTSISHNISSQNYVNGIPLWEGEIELDSDNMIAVNRPVKIVVDVEYASDDYIDSPTIRFPDGRFEGGGQTLDLDVDHENQQITGSAEMLFLNPGTTSVECNITGNTEDFHLQEIASNTDYLMYQNTRYILLLSILSAIIATISLYGK